MSTRPERVAEAIRRLVSGIIQGQLRDPRTAGFITITKVEVTPDLRLAKIYYSVLGDENKKRLVSKGLKSAKTFIRKRIAGELKLRYAPEVVLKPDESSAYRERIDKILEKLHKEEKNEDNRKDDTGDQEIR